MAFCIPPQESGNFLAALKRGDINPDKLMDMTSADRRSFFEGIVGKDYAPEVNALFESKLLLKDQKRGLVTWAKTVSGISEKTLSDFLTKIERLDTILSPQDEKSFLADLAAQKVGTAVTFDEAKTISEGARQLGEYKAAWNGDAWASEDARLRYGTAFVHFQEYIGKLKSDAKALSFKEWLFRPSKWWGTVAGATKGILAAFDNSYFGRQGIKMLYTNPDIWARSFVKSWSDIGKELVKKDAMLPIKADIYSRPNAMNGKYRAGKYALGIESEEAYPSQLPEKIPLLGQLYKASESAFNGAALRMRADYADRMIAKADEFGINTLDPKQAEGIGALVNAMTGRGNITLTPKQGDAINSAFFSIRFLKGNIDTLTMHRLGHGAEGKLAQQFVRRQAAQNLAKIAGSVAAILFTANALWPGSVDFDPRSANFGKIKIGDTRFDVTGGMSALVTLASRLVPTQHNGRWGLWSKSSVTGRWTDLRAGKYGQQNALDIMEQFWEGKLSPIAGTIRDAWKGEVFGGQKATPYNLAVNLVTPLPIQTFMDLMNDRNSAPVLVALILDSLGISTSTYGPGQKKHQ